MNEGLGEGLLVFEVEPELPHPVRRSASEEEDNTRIKTRPSSQGALSNNSHHGQSSLVASHKGTMVGRDFSGMNDIISVIGGLCNSI